MVQEGQTRQNALRIKQKKQEEELAIMLQVLEALRSTSIDDAQDLLKRLRSSENSMEFVRLNQDTSLSWNRGIGAFSLIAPSPLISSGSSTPAHLQTSNTHSHEFARSDSFAAPVHDAQLEPDTTVLCDGLVIPCENRLRDAIDAFFSYSGKLLYVVTREQSDACLNEVFHNTSDNRSESIRLAICEVCSIATIGSHYMSDPLGAEFEDSTFLIASSLLEDTIEEHPLRAVRCFALIAMSRMMTKGRAALAYVGKLSPYMLRQRVFGTSAESLQNLD